MTILNIIWKYIELLLSNLQFYVAVGTISMSVTTAWSVIRQNKLDKIKDLRERINSFYLPFFKVFTNNWKDDGEFKYAWDIIRPSIRNATIKTQKALFAPDIYHKSPKFSYDPDIPYEKKEYEAWDELYQTAWEDFRDLDQKLMKLQGTPGTVPPVNPDEHNFKLKKVI